MVEWLTENDMDKWLCGTEPEFTEVRMKEPLKIVPAVGKVKAFVTDREIGYFVIAY